MTFEIKPKNECRWDVVSLGEVMLRLDLAVCAVGGHQVLHARELFDRRAGLAC